MSTDSYRSPLGLNHGGGNMLDSLSRIEKADKALQDTAEQETGSKPWVNLMDIAAIQTAIAHVEAIEEQNEILKQILEKMPSRMTGPR